ncbi:MAG: M48 family metallopeptidase [Sulfuriflexus sp.]|nr:M48 family metallopeptidase [Sulfuriflexus sp.]
MDFFQHQQQARTSTRKLISLFGFAVLSLLIMTNLLVMFAFGFLDSEISTAAILEQLDWNIFLSVSAVVVSVIFIGSLYKISTLSSGGVAVAEMLGGKLLTHGGFDSDEQKILNVVEEMAIASGTPVPPVYLLEEEGINAFAAGFTASDAVIGITRGAIATLDREQLQGVIAHEFSHIFNGDMRLNIRLIGILHGILVIGIIGYYILRAGGRSRKNGAGLVVLGIGLLVIGYAGTFFGNMIKAAVSRQREFLADASAVQFTRNPDGISGALINIGASEYGSNIENPECSEISHCLFGAGMSSFYSGLFATHPPLDERIKRVKPSWNGVFVANKPKHKHEAADKKTEKAAKEELKKKQTIAATAAVILAGAEQLSKTGEPEQVNLDVAIKLLAGLPETFSIAAREPYGARAVIYALLISDDADIRGRQLSHIEYNADSGVYEKVCELLQARDQLAVDARLPLIELSLPSLRQLSFPQYELFKSIIERLIDLDGKVSLFEWILERLVIHHLRRNFDPKSSRARKYISINKLTDEVSLLLTVMVHVDKQTDLSAAEAFSSAQSELDEVIISLQPKDGISFKVLDSALNKLNQLVPVDKHKLLKACAACLIADGKITHKEAELYRAISEILDCPMPLLVVEE